MAIALGTQNLAPRYDALARASGDFAMVALDQCGSLESLALKSSMAAWLESRPAARSPHGRRVG